MEPYRTRNRVAIFAYGVAFMVFPAAVAAQQAVHSDSSVMAAARDLMKGTPLCDFVTLDAAGAPHARVVAPLFPPEANLTTWIGTNTATRKVAELARDPRATLLCMEPQGTGYVQLAGKTVMVRDSAAKAAHWQAGWEKFFKDGPQSPNFVLIKLVPENLEIVSYTRGMISDTLTWKPVVIRIPRSD